MCEEKSYTAFAGYKMIGQGEIQYVLSRCKKIFDEGCEDRIVVYEDSTGQMYDFELKGEEEEVIGRLTLHPMIIGKKPAISGSKNPGRPKLGVVSREVSLLPKHWKWLNEQGGTASGTIRRLIDEEKKRFNARENFKKQQAATHRFMWDIAGDMAGFEEASRLLYSKDFEGLKEIIVTWPQDLFKHLGELIDKLKLLNTEALLEDEKRKNR